MKHNTTPQTEAISRIDTSGNMIPVNWYKTIQKQESKSGKIARKPHLLAINILADIVYWHKNTVIRDEITAEVIEVRKRFAADLLQRSYASIVNMFGCSDKDAREAVAFLESLGLITRVFRNLSTPNGIMPNVMYINVHAAIIEMATITNTPLPQTSEMCPQNGGDVPPKEETSIDETGEYTDTTTNTTTDSTTKETSISFPTKRKQAQQEPNLSLEHKKESHPPVPLAPPPLKSKGKKDRSSIAIPSSLNNAAFLEEWEKLLQTKKWKTKEDSTIEGILEKLATFDVRFATELANQARLNEWQGIIFAQTAKNYEMWLKSNAQPNNSHETVQLSVLTNSGLKTLKIARKCKAYEIAERLVDKQTGLILNEGISQEDKNYIAWITKNIVNHINQNTAEKQEWFCEFVTRKP